MSRIRHLLVATDFSECSRHAVDFATDLAQKLEASLLLLHVWEITPLVAMGLDYGGAEVIDAIEETSRAALEKEVQRVRERLPAATSELRGGIAWEEVGRVAQEKSIDLVVLGTHGRTGLRRLALGSVADRVVRTSPVPVITVRHP